MNQVWATDITYIPMKSGFVYLVAITLIMDWYSRRVPSWRLSNTLDTSFCVDALEEALERFGQPKISNTDQGSQFTSEDLALGSSRRLRRSTVASRGAQRDAGRLPRRRPQFASLPLALPLMACFNVVLSIDDCAVW